MSTMSVTTVNINGCWGNGWDGGMYSHLATPLQGIDIVRYDKSSFPCQKVLAVHPQTHKAHKQAINPLLRSLLHSFLSFTYPLVSPPAFKIKVSH